MDTPQPSNTTPSNTTSVDPRPTDQRPGDHRPADQQARAAQAQPNSNDPACGPVSPGYGEFGSTVDASASGTAATPSNNAPRANDGSNDNPDEFSEFRKPNKTGTEDYSPEAARVNPEQQPGHVQQNQDPAAIRAARGKDEDVQRTAWADDDPRYGSGQRTSWPSNEPSNITPKPEQEGSDASEANR
jgi:hypothetical protein